MKSAVEAYNGLNGAIATREQLQEVVHLGNEQGQTHVAEKVAKLLNTYDDAEFEITLSREEIERLPEEFMAAMEEIIPEEDFTGLEKAVSPDDIYQMITDKMLAQLKEATGKGYKKKWKKQNEEGYLLPFNFDTKKMYRGINIALLTEGMSKVLKNPFFLTFNQIEKHKGKLKKGSKGLPVVYFTMLYSVSETNEAGEKVEYGTYNKKKWLSWLDKNIHRLKFSLDYYRKTYIPILKYYNVFNGADVDGIDFDLENFKIGYQDGSEVVKNNDSRVEIADLIVKHYPNPQPKLKDSTDGRAFYRHGFTADEIHMPKFENFDTGLDYYRTLFHEFTHSTGIASRLDRPMGGKFGSKQYAKEELVAEFGAVFLSAHAGIIWYNQKNHAEYLKNWNTVLTHAKDDNRFFMRAASKAQEATDFLLNLDKEGIPAYQKELLKKAEKAEKKKDPEKTEKPKKAQKKGDEISKDYPFSPSDIPYQTAYDAHRGTSFSPEKRAKGEQNSYFQFLKNTYDRLKEKAEKTDRLEEFENNFPRFQEGYKKRTIKLLQTKNGLMSTMITGPANFPVRRMEKKQNSVHKRLNELVDYSDKAEKYILPHKSTAIKSGKEDTISKLKSKLEKLEETHQQMKEMNKIIRKFKAKKYTQEEREKGIIEGLKKYGYSEGETRKNFLTPDYTGKIGLPSFMLSNSNANIKRIKERIAQEEKLKGQENKTFPFDGGQIVFNPGINKIQIHFDGKPEKEIRDFLKKAGQAYKWSPRNKVWQRQLNTYYSLNRKDLFEFLGVETDKPKNPVPKKKPKSKTKDPAQLGLFGAKKKKSSPKKKGLSAPVENKEVPSNGVPHEVPQPPVILPENRIEPKPVPQPKPEKPGGAKSLAEAMRQPTNTEVFNVPGDIGRFLGQVEKKPVHSVVTTLDAEQGAGKTRLLFQVMNVMAGMGLNCLFISLEEHPASKLFRDKVQQYIDPANLERISAIDEVEDWQKVRGNIEAADIIFVDSFQKLPPKLDLDKDIRKAFNGKWFFIIYQQTGTKGMRGGSKAAFDGDQILKVSKDPEDYRNNYVYANKNRYNDAPDLKLNIFTGKLQGEEPEQQNDSTSSRVPAFDPGGLIITPID